jgi:hypothetical protein
MSLAGPCRLCVMMRGSAHAQRSIAVIHEVFQSGVTGELLAEHCAQLFEELGLEPASASELMQHVEAHVELSPAPELIVEPINEEESTYLEMRALYSDLKPMLAVARQDATASQAGLTTHKMQVLCTLIREMRQILKNMHDMRSHEGVTTAILERHSAAFTQVAVEQLSTRISALQFLLEKDGGTERLAEAFQEFLTDLPEVFLEAAKTSIEQSRQVYKLS